MPSAPPGLGIRDVYAAGRFDGAFRDADITVRAEIENRGREDAGGIRLYQAQHAALYYRMMAPLYSLLSGDEDPAPCSEGDGADPYRAGAGIARGHRVALHIGLIGRGCSHHLVDPGITIEIEFVFQITIGNAVLRFLVDFLLRVIGAEVAFSAVLGLAGSAG